jgi:hypothetical protein
MGGRLFWFGAAGGIRLLRRPGWRWTRAGRRFITPIRPQTTLDAEQLNNIVLKLSEIQFGT